MWIVTHNGLLLNTDNGHIIEMADNQGVITYWIGTEAGRRLAATICVGSPKDARAVFDQLVNRLSIAGSLFDVRDYLEGMKR